MKQEIKERVEKIRRGEVPEGYKKTKVGIIPEDWEVIKLKEIGSFSKGKGISKSDVINCGKGCIRYGEIYTSHHVFIKNFKSFISDEDATNSKFISKGDILFAGSGETAEEIGKAVCYMMDDEAYAGGDIIILSPKNKNNYFYGYVLNHNLVNKQTRIKGQGQSVVHIYSKDLGSVRIPNPHNYEENKIAEILSTWDKAIELKQKLIEEKKEFKRGLMQRLLTGGTRFPEFTDEWEETRLGKKLTFIKKESIENPQNHRLLKVQLHLKGIEATENYPKHTENGRPYHLRSEGELLIGRQNFHNGGIGIIPKGMNGYIASNAISSLKSSDDNLMYYYYYLSNPNFYKKVGHLIGGTGQKEISESMFKNLKMTLPSNDEEIKKISATIKTIYQDLEMENNILSQLKQQKRGLSQLLLTGIVRVEVN